MKSTDQHLIETAMHDYHAACEELNRPNEDVVTYCVCHLTREAICSFLRLYLKSKNVSSTGAETLDELIAFCKKNNREFSNFDFSILVCSHLSQKENPANYCLNEERVNKCFHLLDSLKNYMTEELQLMPN